MTDQLFWFSSALSPFRRTATGTKKTQKLPLRVASLRPPLGQSLLVKSGLLKYLVLLCPFACSGRTAMATSFPKGWLLCAQRNFCVWMLVDALHSALHSVRLFLNARAGQSHQTHPLVRLTFSLGTRLVHCQRHTFWWQSFSFSWL